MRVQVPLPVFINSLFYKELGHSKNGCVSTMSANGEML